MEVSPFLKELPLGAQSNVEASFTTRARIARSALLSSNLGDDADSVSTNILPYASVSATTRQLFPLLGPTNPSSARRPLILALRYSVTASTRSVPRHVAKAIGTTSNIRGSTPNERPRVFVGAPDNRALCTAPAAQPTQATTGRNSSYNRTPALWSTVASRHKGFVSTNRPKVTRWDGPPKVNSRNFASIRHDIF